MPIAFDDSNEDKSASVISGSDLIRIQDAKTRLSDAYLQDVACRAERVSGRTIFAVVVLRSLIDHVPTNEGAAYIAVLVLESTSTWRSDPDRDKENIKLLANSYCESLLIPLLALRQQRTAPPSENQTPDTRTVEGLIDSANKGDQKALNKLVRLRDDNKCCMTGAPCYKHHRNSPLHKAPLEVAHILPLSLNKFDENSNDSVHDTAITMSMLKAWIAVDWAGSQISNPSNAILLTLNQHSTFGGFLDWLERDPTEPLGQSNAYIAKSHINTLHHRVVFKDHSGSLPPIPLPSPTALAIHAAIAKVLWDSGAADYFNAVCFDEDTDGLAEDGSTDISAALGHIIFDKVSKRVDA